MIPPEQAEAKFRESLERGLVEAFHLGVKAEREACAKVAEEFEANAMGRSQLGADVASNIAAAIRSRNSK